MSTVYWSNALVDGKVSSNSEDLYAVYKHADKLDGLCRTLGLTELSSFVDNTDLMVNLDQLDMPDGMESTDELMAMQGNWIDATLAADALEKLLEHVSANNIRFGLVSNARDDIIEELGLAAAFARRAADEGGKFNLAVVM